MKEFFAKKEKCLQCQLQYPIDCYSDHCPIAFSLLRKQEKNSTYRVAPELVLWTIYVYRTKVAKN